MNTHGVQILVSDIILQIKQLRFFGENAGSRAQIGNKQDEHSTSIFVRK